MTEVELARSNAFLVCEGIIDGFTRTSYMGCSARSVCETILQSLESMRQYPNPEHEQAILKLAPFVNLTRGEP